MASAYDDDIWSAVPADRTPAPAAVREFIAGLGHVERALDLGCGDGLAALDLDARELTLADVSPVALARARARLPESEAVELEPDRPLPLADNRFELVLCVDTIEHVRDVQTFLSEIRRVLVPGGVLALSTPAHSRATGLRVLLGGFEQVFDPRSQHLRFFTRGSLGELLDQMGFVCDRLEARSGLLLALARR